jgi:hypothetical protein
MDYHKIIIDIRRKYFSPAHTKLGKQRAYKVVTKNLCHSKQQEVVKEEIERIGHKIRNLWNIIHRLTGNPLSLFCLDIEPAANNNEIGLRIPHRIPAKHESPN